MSSANSDYQRDLRAYLVGIGLAALLTAIPFALVAWGGFGRTAVLATIGVCALVQVAVHLRYFLHIDFSRQQREDLHLILFSTLLLILMAGGTVWVLANLAGRMVHSPVSGG